MSQAVTALRPGTPPAAVATRRRAAYRPAWLALALAGVGLAALASVAVGVAVVGWHDVVRGLAGDDATLGSSAVLKRVPRTVLALLVGGALGVSGAVMQGVTRNPLADPAMLGITNGASLAVVTGIAFFGLSSPSAYLWVAIGGAGATAALVYAVGSMGRGGATPLKLALAGAATAAALSSLVSAVLLPRIDAMTQFRFWQVGGVGGADWHRIGLMLPFLAAGTLACLACARGLNSLAVNGSGDRDFHEAKIITARFFAERELSKANSLRRQVEAGAESLMKLPEEAF